MLRALAIAKNSLGLSRLKTAIRPMRISAIDALEFVMIRFQSG